MSVELRYTDSDLVCDWGVVDTGNPRPDIGDVGHLMLTTREYFGHLFKNGPEMYHGALHSVDAVPDLDANGEFDDDSTIRLYAYIDYQGKRWTWELFEAHWWDGKGPDMYLGVWPD